jgi:hypothetical protein
VLDAERVLEAEALIRAQVALGRLERTLVADEPAKGVKRDGAPNLISGWPKTASVEATRRSQRVARSKPPPSAGPLTAAIVGFGNDQTAWC